ncbi:helix-turn-helix domain-containing protein [Caballeronia sordidicola]|uniref:helix-turn-helix domain-containing protein n=1 Tax=Caballeronia sordidicola TaxID=196367 RepID=UPI0007C83A34|nr:helix-turn-helix transcriptional regulator [Caballeronia sordidicola]
MLLPHMADNTTERQRALRELVATNLKLFRGKQGLSQEGLADRAGLHRTQVSQIERALTSVMLDTLASLALALGVNEAQLLTEQNESPVPLKSGPKKKAELISAKKTGRKAV